MTGSPEDPAGVDPIDLRRSHSVQVGSGNVQHNYFAEPAVQWPVQVGSVPRQADGYQPRSLPARDADTPTLVLTGTGGAGKTQLAAALAREAKPGLDVLLWVTAVSRTSIVDAYARAAALLGSPLTGGDAEAAAAWLVEWLARTERSWLVVLDDLADPADARGLWPEGAGGATLVTTRRTDAVLRGRGRQRVDVGVFTPAEARDYLHQQLDVSASEADALAVDLGHLALALAQASTYILDRGVACADYRRRLADRRRSLAALFPADALADDYASTVAATWSLSIVAADQLEPRGVSSILLQALALADPNGFPIGLATCQPLLTAVSAVHDSPDTLSVHDCRDALHNLARLSLLDLDPSDGPRAVRIHALLQRATRDGADEQHRRALLQAMAASLAAIWPDLDRDVELAQSLRANATQLIEHDHSAALWALEETRDLLWRNGRSIGESGQFTGAVDYWTRIVATADAVLGADHDSTLSARYNLAGWTGDAGNPAGAVAQLESTVDDLVRAHGPTHSDLVTYRNLLARFRGEAGNPAGAVAELEHLLADVSDAHDLDHLDVLTTRYNLGGWRGEAGDAHGALEESDRLLADCLRVLGPDHQLTIDVRSGRGLWRGETGDAVAAVDDFTRVLEDRVRTLGPRSWKSLNALADLAWWQGSAGRVVEALATSTDLVVSVTEIFGPEHPSTLKDRTLRLRWLGEAGAPRQAAAAAEELVADCSRILGPEHPQTLNARAAAADWLGEAGDLAGAVTALDNLFRTQTEVLGAAHPATLETRQVRAWWYGNAGHPEHALDAIRKLLPDLIRVHGPDHPATDNARHHLVRWLSDIGDIAAATDEGERLFTDRVRKFGPGHPASMAVRHNLLDLYTQTTGKPDLAGYDDLVNDYEQLYGVGQPAVLPSRMAAANAYGAAGDTTTALQRHRTLVADHIALLQPDHPRTLLARANLAHALAETGDLIAAQHEADAVLTDSTRVLGPEHPDTKHAHHAALTISRRDHTHR